MKDPSGNYLSRRESEVMDIVYRLGEATVADVLEEMEEPPGYNSVRSTMGILEDKGLLEHRESGQSFVYSPTASRNEASRSAVRHLVETFFDGSAPRAVAALVDEAATELEDEDIADIARIIEAAKQERDDG